MGPWSLDYQFNTAPNSHMPMQELPHILCDTEFSMSHSQIPYTIWKQKGHGFCHIFAVTAFPGAQKIVLEGDYRAYRDFLSGQNNAMLNALLTQQSHSQLQKWGRTGPCHRLAHSLQGLHWSCCACRLPWLPLAYCPFGLRCPVQRLLCRSGGQGVTQCIYLISAALQHR